MIIIGEKLNGTIPSVARAIAARDGEWIKDVALRQPARILSICARRWRSGSWRRFTG